MSLLTLPQAQIPLTLNGNAISVEWYRWAHDITIRAGGVNGPSTNDLAVAEYADAGIEELRAGLFMLADTLGQEPPTIQAEQAADPSGELSALREELASLRERVASLEQGQMV